jgi:hypothetical protein
MTEWSKMPQLYDYVSIMLNAFPVLYVKWCQGIINETPNW